MATQTVREWLEELNSEGIFIQFEGTDAQHPELSPDRQSFLEEHFAEIGATVTGKDPKFFAPLKTTRPPSIQANLNDPKYQAPALMGERIAYESRNGAYHQTPAIVLGVERITGQSLGECTDPAINPEGKPTLRAFFEENCPAEIIEMFAFSTKIQRKIDGAIREWARFSYDGLPLNRKRTPVPYPGKTTGAHDPD